MPHLIQPNHGYHVYGWMLDLGLRGLELNLYALIYSFTANGGTVGKIAYFEAWTGAKRCSVMSALKRLKDKELIVGTKCKGNSTAYSANSLKDRLVEKIDYSENQTMGSLESRLVRSENQTSLTKRELKGKRNAAPPPSESQQTSSPPWVAPPLTPPIGQEYEMPTTEEIQDLHSIIWTTTDSNE